VKVPDAAAAIEQGRLWIERHGPITHESFSSLLDAFREDWRASSIQARTFPNVCPLPGVGSMDVIDGLVTAAHPDYHDVDLCECPTSVLCAVVDTWAALHAWAETKGFTLAMFINGGRDRRSGQSFAHPHSQTLVFAGRPPLYDAIQSAKDHGKCPICELQDMRELHIPVPGTSTLLLMAHPAPEQSWSLIIVSRNCADGFSEIGRVEFSTLFALALRALAITFGSVPPYNLVLRVGAGHFHAEIVPRNTNIKAGAEILIHEFFVDAGPAYLRAALTSAISEGVAI
jgi:galactose-1-phosphate uridylyltransferase